jgi:hypothetical protein
LGLNVPHHWVKPFNPGPPFGNEKLPNEKMKQKNSKLLSASWVVS